MEPHSLTQPTSLVNITRDRHRETARQRSHFAKVRNAEAEYAARLRSIATQVGNFVKAFFHRGSAPDRLAAGLAAQQLEAYAATIRPWAEATASRMLADVSRRDAGAWSRLARTMARSLRVEIEQAPTGATMREALARQVDLITSLPREAAARVQAIATGNLYSGLRAGEIRGDPAKARGLAAEILRTGQVTVSRANLIARTETTRVAGELQAARAQYVGSEGYVWRTAEDRDVRRCHRRLNGTFHRWDDPPVATEPGQKVMRYHPGRGPNCRCYAEPVLPDRIV